MCVFNLGHKGALERRDSQLPSGLVMKEGGRPSDNRIKPLMR